MMWEAIPFNDVYTEFVYEEIDIILWDMVMLSVVEYVITNHEYGSLIENGHHYLSGRNNMAYNIWEKDLMEHPEWMASYILMLCEMKTHK